MQHMPFILEKGGVFMWPLLLCSITSLAVIIERSVYFIFNQGPGRKLLSTILPMLQQNRLKEFQDYCQKTRGPLSRVCRAYLDSSDLSKEERDEILFREGSVALAGLERRLRVLAFITEISPLLGFLGTVTGMIAAFRKIQEMGGEINVPALAGGIWEALLTTAVGLSIAIPTAAAYNFFEARVDKMQARMHYVIAYLNEWVGMKNDKAASSE